MPYLTRTAFAKHLVHILEVVDPNGVAEPVNRTVHLNGVPLLQNGALGNPWFESRFASELTLIPNGPLVLDSYVAVFYVVFALGFHTNSEVFFAVLTLSAIVLLGTER